MTNDIIADTLTKIRNATIRKHETVVLPQARMVKSIIDILKNEKYIESYKEDPITNQYEVTLKYIDKKSVVTHLERVSKPGLRRYVNYTEIPKVLNGLGISIISTSKGVMTGKQAKYEEVGGEFLCKIW